MKQYLKSINNIIKRGIVMVNVKRGFFYITATIIIMASIIVIYQLKDSKTSEIKSENSKKIIIKFISSWAGTDTKASALEEIISNFEFENENIRIENKSMSGSEFLFTLKTNFAQGNDPDVFGLWPGSDIKTLINQGKVAELSNILNDDEWKNKIGEAAWSYNEFNGGIYGVPCEIIYEGLFINKDLFEKYHVKIPETYDDLKEAILKFNGVGIVPIAYSCTAEGTYIYQNIVSKLGGKEDTENPYDENGIKECYLKGLDYMKEIYEMGGFPSNVFTLDDNDRDNLFKNKKAAMIVQGSWFIGEGSIDGNDESIDLIPFPEFNEGKALKGSMIYGLGNGNFHISQVAWDNEEKRMACIKFLKYITSEEAAQILSESSGFISNIQINNSEKISKLNTKGKELVKSAQELIGPTDSFVDRNKWEQILVPNFPRVLEGKMSPEEMFQLMVDD